MENTNKIRKGGIGMIEEGKLAGRRFIIPNEVWVEKTTFIGGTPEYSLACLIHERFIPTGGCPQCKEEVLKLEKANKEIGLD